MSASAQPKVVQVKVDEIRPNDWNPNVVPDHVQAALEKNIERAGFNQPVLLRETDDGYEIVDGEHRWRAARARGDKTVPAIVRDFSVTEAKLQTIAMNKLRGEMEPADVARLIREAEEDGIPLAEQAEFTGYTGEELTGLTNLLEFDWSNFGKNDGAGAGEAPQPGDEEWVDLRFRVPESVAVVVRSEIDRLKGIRETEHDHLALELMAVTSALTPPEGF